MLEIITHYLNLYILLEYVIPFALAGLVILYLAISIICDSINKRRK